MTLRLQSVRRLAPLLLAAAFTRANAQATPAASTPIRLSSFAGITGTYTGLLGGRNADITAGVDFGLRPGARFRPSLEVRGTYPIDGGGVDSQENILGGLRIDTRYNRFRPYIDILGGRGQIDYLGAGIAVPSKFIFYTKSHSNVYAAGGGFDYQLAPHIFLKLDGQFQHYTTPVTDSGTIYAKAGTVGVAYDFHRRHAVR